MTEGDYQQGLWQTWFEGYGYWDSFALFYTIWVVAGFVVAWITATLGALFKSSFPVAFGLAWACWALSGILIFNIIRAYMWYSTLGTSG